jgi:ubiquinone/menaquinone biosynthesis C-methylase UbiE/uncharacterized protein YbaR (Trm112 family)
MRKSLLDMLVCPQCRAPLVLEALQTGLNKNEILQGNLTCLKCAQRYPIQNGIPILLVSADYHASIYRSFGFQWQMRKNKLFETKTLYGRDAEATLSNFFDRLKKRPEEIRGKRILDAGCGSGMLDHALSKTGCEVVGLDLTDLAEAYAINREHENVHIVRADIFHLPFSDEAFDIIWSEGVLHHTPDPKKAFDSLNRVLKRGGMSYVWVYSKSPKERMRRLFRTPRLPRALLYLFCYLLVVPYAVWQGLRILFQFRGTAFAFFDALSPRYQSEHDREEVRQWFLSTGFSRVETTEDRGPFWQAVWSVGVKQ